MVTMKTPREDRMLARLVLVDVFEASHPPLLKEGERFVL
jgi:hypothetical protein